MSFSLKSPSYETPGQMKPALQALNPTDS